VPSITALEPAPGRLGGFLLEIDGGESFRVSVDLQQVWSLSVGGSLSDAEVEALVRQAGASEAMDRAVHYLSYRPRTCREVALYLRKHGLFAHADGAIARCVELGYLNDESYARSFVRERIRLKPRGKPRLVTELLARGIDRELAEAAVRDTLADEGVTEVELLRAVAIRRARSLRNLDPPAARRRLAAYLRRRGFPAGEIRDVVREVLPERAEDAGT
jgi:regulatory protein